jgi:hypothetical protein
MNPVNNWQKANYLNLSTKKRDGAWVNTPIWFARSNNSGIFYAFSEGRAGKIKRIRNFSDVKVAPCTVTGKLNGSYEAATAEILDAKGIQIAHQALLKQYGWQMRVLDWGSKLAGKFHRRAYLKITLQN